MWKEKSKKVVGKYIPLKASFLWKNYYTRYEHFGPSQITLNFLQKSTFCFPDFGTTAAAFAERAICYISSCGPRPDFSQIADK